MNENIVVEDVWYKTGMRTPLKDNAQEVIDKMPGKCMKKNVMIATLEIHGSW